DELLVRMLTPTLWRDGGNGAFQDLQQCLLYTFTGDITRYGWIIRLARNLIYLIDVDNAAACSVHIEVRCLQQFEQDVLYVFADITSLSQRRGVCDSERNVQHARESLRQVGLTGTSRSKHQDIRLRNLNFFISLGSFPGARRFSSLRLFSLDALVVVVHRYRQHALGRILANNVLVEEGRNFRRTWKLLFFAFSGGSLSCTKFFFNDFIAELNALITNVHTATGDQLLNLLLALATEGTLKQVSAFLHTCHEDLST